MRICTKCFIKKDTSSFSKDNRATYGLQSKCKECASNYYKANRELTLVRVKANAEANPDRIQTYKKNYYQENRNELLAEMKPYYETNKNRIRDRNLYSYYGIREVDYQRMFISQNGVCAICKSPANGKKGTASGTLHVDHPHIKGYSRLPPKEKAKAVRGLLCGKCNTFIGMAKENIQTLEAAISYLRGLPPCA